MFERFAASTRETVQAAYELAREQRAGEIREEHLLQALLAGADSGGLRVSAEAGTAVLNDVAAARRRAGLSEVDAAALASIGIDLESVLKRTEAELGSGSLQEPGRRDRPWRPRGEPPMSSGSRRVLQAALRQAVALGDRELRAEHLLLGLLVRRSLISDTMAAHGITSATVLGALEQLRAPRPDGHACGGHDGCMVLAAEVLLGALILALTGALVVGRSGGLEDESADAPPFTLPPGRLSVAELRALRLPMAVRGYRMAEVDALLGRLTDQLDDGGRAAAPEPGGAPVDPPGPRRVPASAGGSRQLLGVAMVATTATAVAWALVAAGALPTLVAGLVSVVAVLALPLVWQVYGTSSAGNPEPLVADTHLEGSAEAPAPAESAGHA